MDFEKRKAATLASLASSVTDKSPKGTLDTQILPLINTLNSHPSYFTTSSCSGRISILSQPKPNPNSTNKKKARGGTWIYITHEKADPTQIISLLFSNQSTESTELVFRFEPLIIAIECKTVESAQFVVSLGISSGFRESGITSVSKKRVIVGIRCSIRMEVPLGFSDRVLVSEEYVRFLVDLGNEKMEANWKRTEVFLMALTESFWSMGFGNVNGDCEFGDDGVDARDGDAVVLEFSSAVDHEGLEGDPDYSLSVRKLTVVKEPVEKLYLWGHSSCVLDHGKHCNKILVFGGFGGMGRHARRSDSFVFDPISGMLEIIDCQVMPFPRLGHTASLVGDSVFVIGGRADPLSILSDVWTLDISKNEWRLLKCPGDLIPPRHRHAAAVAGSNIYVFGGLNNDAILSSMHVLSTNCLQWKEVVAGGELPCARHSHAMVACESQLLLFGGYNGEKALGDLFSFDIQTCTWKKEKTSGRTPCARFSHSMFVYKNFVGVIGGCPVSQHFQELALLDLRFRMWKHVTLEYIGKELLVRSTANVVGDDLIIIGGGAACYAFGTKFSEPLKINLLLLMSTKDQLISPKMKEHVNNQFGCINGENNVEIQCSEGEHNAPEMNSEAENHAKVCLLWVLQFERKYAKLGKDILKKFGWLDLERKVYTQKDGLHICFPVTEKFHIVFKDKKHHIRDAVEDVHMTKQFTGERILLSELSSSTALNLLKECRGVLLEDKVVEVRRTAKSPLQTMKEVVASLIETKGLPTNLLEQLPTRWERLGDITVLPITSFKDPIWGSMGDELWPVVAKSLNARRLARQGQVAPTGTRDSMLEMLIGDDGWVDHRENGIIYSFDATKCMFSWGNLSEKLRMGNMPCRDEIIVDLFAGIGYFVLPFLVRANAKLVYACEWNPHAIQALKRNLNVNSVSERCTVLEGDNRMTAPKGVANRVCLGLLPTSEGSWVTAVRALRSEGGTLHVHANVKDTEENSWCQYVSKSIDKIAKSEGLCWEVLIEHVERVKWYAPHIRHLVADVKCKQIRR